MGLVQEVNANQENEKAAKRSSGAGRWIAAAVLFASAMVFNHVWVGHTLSFTGQITDLAVLVLIWSSQIVLATTGLLTWWIGGTRQGRATILVFICSVALCFILLLAGAQLIPGPVDSTTAQLDGSDNESRLQLPQFSDVPWAADYWRESPNAPRRFRPFTMWQRRPYEGKYITVSKDGTRKTWNRALDDEQDVIRIWTFGGSTMWGTGARDDYTIASCISRLLDEQGAKVEVTNFGETGYVFTQEVVRLVMELRTRPAPDLVIFYDGVNDVYAGFQLGAAGGFMNHAEFEKSYNRMRYISRSNFLKASYLSFSELLLKHCRLYQIVNSIPERKKEADLLAKRKAEFPDAPDDLQFSEVGATMSKEELNKLAKRLVSTYEGTSSVVEGLSRGYGFKYLLLWQPVLFLEEKTFEQEFVDVRSQDPALAYLTKETTSRLKSRKLKQFHDVSNALAQRTAPVYFDYCHILEPGNEAVARSVVQIIDDEQALARDIAKTDG